MGETKRFSIGMSLPRAVPAVVTGRNQTTAGAARKKSVTDKNLLLGFAEEGDLVFFGGVFFASACFESGESRAFPETE